MTIFRFISNGLGSRLRKGWNRIMNRIVKIESLTDFCNSRPDGA